jgi:hypothetical protein
MSKINKAANKFYMTNEFRHTSQTSFEAGAKWALAQVKALIEKERSEYKKSAEEFDRRGDTLMGTNELRCVLTCEHIHDLVSEIT